MADAFSISEAEWEVMLVLWEQSPLTAAQVVERLAGRRDWTPATIKTLINRLLKKQSIDSKPQGKRFIYWPAVTRQHCIRHRSRGFLDRVFGGAAGPLLAHFVAQVELSPAEIEELKRLLDDKLRESRKGRKT